MDMQKRAQAFADDLEESYGTRGHWGELIRYLRSIAEQDTGNMQKRARELADQWYGRGKYMWAGDDMAEFLLSLAAQPAEPVAQFLSSCEHIMWMRGGAWFGGTIADLRIVAAAPPQTSTQAHKLHPGMQAIADEVGARMDMAAELLAKPQAQDADNDVGPVDLSDVEPDQLRATPPAVEDEQAAFEAWALSQSAIMTAPWMWKMAWESWQARAALKGAK